MLFDPARIGSDVAVSCRFRSAPSCSGWKYTFLCNPDWNRSESRCPGGHCQNPQASGNGFRGFRLAAQDERRGIRI